MIGDLCFVIGDFGGQIWIRKQDYPSDSKDAQL
jgi:hypothetical protein